VPVMRELAANRRRKTAIQIRGNFLVEGQRGQRRRAVQRFTRSRNAQITRRPVSA